MVLSGRSHSIMDQKPKWPKKAHSFAPSQRIAYRTATSQVVSVSRPVLLTDVP